MVSEDTHVPVLAEDGETLLPGGGDPSGGGERCELALTLLHHPDRRRRGQRARLGTSFCVELSRTAPHFYDRRGREIGPLADRYVSRKPLVVASRSDGSVHLHSELTAPGLRVEGTALGGERTVPAAALEAGVTIALGGRVLALLHRVAVDPPVGEGAPAILGTSDGVAALRKRIAEVADSVLPVLVRGETGTGKELVARAIHEAGPRAEGPLVAVNMGAIPESTAAAALFGHRAGAFTGARASSPGYVAAAAGGTLFLDEIGETPLSIQPLLLRLLESGEIQPVGAARPTHVDFRMVAATDADLEALERRGALRPALLHRLEAQVVYVPPLRERREDIPLLVAAFPGDVELDCDTVDRLVRAPWPGNVRQLRNAARLLAERARRGAKPGWDTDLDRLVGAPGSTETPRGASDAPEATPRMGPDSPALVDALRRHGWEIRAAADALGVARNTVYAWVQRSQSIRLVGDVPIEELEAAIRASEGSLDAAARRLEVSRRSLVRRAKELGLVERD